MEAYKRITEVREGQITNETKVLAVDTDGVKQISPDALGAVKTVNGTQPDEHGNIEIPGLPDGASPCQQLVTDADGNMAWENKTHYAHSELIVVLPEAKIQGRKSAVLNQFSQFSDKLSSGHEYTVVYNGTEYKCTPQHNDVLFTNVLGNASLADVGEDTGEPFFFTALYNSDMTFVYFAEEGDHTISINDGIVETIVPFDKKYLPPEVIADIEKLSNDKPYQQYVTDENGVAKWEERTHYKSGLITVKLSPENTSAETSASSRNYYVAEDDNEGNMSFEVRSVFRAIAEDISKYQGERNDYAVYWDGIRYTGKIPRLPGKVTFGDPTDINLPYMMVYSTVNGVRVQVVFYDEFEHIFAFEAFNYNIMPLNEEFIPTTVPVIPSATVGQTIAVKSVDENGKPVEWETKSMKDILSEEIANMGGGSGGAFVVTVAADENGNFIADHYLNDIAAACDRGEIPIVKMSHEGETIFCRICSIDDTVALFYHVTLAGNVENADVLLAQVHITDATVAHSMRNIFAQ